jgi:hypothetical protein
MMLSDDYVDRHVLFVCVKFTFSYNIILNVIWL